MFTVSGKNPFAALTVRLARFSSPSSHYRLHRSGLGGQRSFSKKIEADERFCVHVRCERCNRGNVDHRVCAEETNFPSAFLSPVFFPLSLSRSLPSLTPPLPARSLLVDRWGGGVCLFGQEHPLQTTLGKSVVCCANHIMLESKSSELLFKRNTVVCKLLVGHHPTLFPHLCAHALASSPSPLPPSWPFLP